MTITTEAEYDAAIAECDRLTDIPRTTEQHLRLLELFEAVEIYEEVHYPMGEDA